jgi:hypothetical protein
LLKLFAGGAVERAGAPAGALPPHPPPPGPPFLLVLTQSARRPVPLGSRPSLQTLAPSPSTRFLAVWRQNEATASPWCPNRAPPAITSDAAGQLARAPGVGSQARPPNSQLQLFRHITVSMSCSVCEQPGLGARDSAAAGAAAAAVTNPT